MNECEIGSDIISSISFGILLSLGIKIWCPMSEFSAQMCTFSAQHSIVLRCESQYLCEPTLSSLLQFPTIYYFISNIEHYLSFNLSHRVTCDQILSSLAVETISFSWSISKSLFTVGEMYLLKLKVLDDLLTKVRSNPFEPTSSGVRGPRKVMKENLCFLTCL